MIKIKTRTGIWRDGTKIETILTDSCPNPFCNVGKVNYPARFGTPICPTCSTKLLGAILSKVHSKRIAFHLEA